MFRCVHRGAAGGLRAELVSDLPVRQVMDQVRDCSVSLRNMGVFVLREGKTRLPFGDDSGLQSGANRTFVPLGFLGPQPFMGRGPGCPGRGYGSGFTSVS